MKVDSKREKAIKAFECCMIKNCDECPYKTIEKTESWQNTCDEQLAIDVFDILKSICKCDEKE